MGNEIKTAMTTAQAAQYLGVCRQRVWQLAQAGRLVQLDWPAAAKVHLYTRGSVEQTKLELEAWAQSQGRAR